MELENIRILGKLMTTEEYHKSYPEGDENFDSVYDVSSWNPRLHLKPVSQLPEELNDVKSFLCLADKLDDDLVHMRKEDIKNLLQDKYIIFRPFLGDDNVYRAYDPEYLDKNNDSIVPYEQYTAIPYIDLISLKLSIDDFEKKLEYGYTVKIGPKLSFENDDKVDVIMVRCKKTTGKMPNVYFYSGVEMSSVANSVTFKMSNPTANRKMLDLKTDADKIITSVKNDIAFIPYDVEEKYLQAVITEDSVKLTEVDNKKDEVTFVQPLPVNTTVDIAPADVVSDNNFIEKLKSVAVNAGLVYDDLDLLNFHISVSSSNLVILAGMSGTGKSKLAKTYAKALGMEDYNGVKFIAVSPAWTDDSDVLGYVDYKNMLYRESDTGLVSMLKDAEEHPERKYLVCFDEMNLARVEHYFSQFISILEDDPIERKLVLYNENLEGKLYNSMLYPANIKIGSNVIFVGTVNVDESTFNFTDKVLDRANVIKLKMQPFSMLKNIVKDFKLLPAEIEFFTELHNTLHDENPKMGLGYRIITQINQYLNLVDGESGYSRKNALDRLIVQRIITKLRGSENQLSALVGNIGDDGKLENSKIVEVLDKYFAISDFKEVRSELKNKAKELNSYGYTI